MHKNGRNKEPQSPIAAGLVCIFVVCFGIFWTIMAASMYWPMAIFGVLFTTIGALNAYNTFKSIKENAEKQHEHRCQRSCKHIVSNLKSSVFVL